MRGELTPQRVACSLLFLRWGNHNVSTVSVVEVVGGWVVAAETQTGGRPQKYLCPTLALAQRWASILGAPRRETMATPLRLRAPVPRADDELTYTVTWVGPPEVAGLR